MAHCSISFDVHDLCKVFLALSSSLSLFLSRKEQDNSYMSTRESRPRINMPCLQPLVYRVESSEASSGFPESAVNNFRRSPAADQEKTCR